MNSLGNGRDIDFSGLRDYAVKVSNTSDNKYVSNVINLSKKADLNNMTFKKLLTQLKNLRKECLLNCQTKK